MSETPVPIPQLERRQYSSTTAVAAVDPERGKNGPISRRKVIQLLLGVGIYGATRAMGVSRAFAQGDEVPAEVARAADEQSLPQPLQLTIENPERLGNIQPITSVPITLPSENGTIVTFHGDAAALQARRITPVEFSPETYPIIQEIADEILLDVGDQITVLSVNKQISWGDNSGRPTAQGTRQGEVLVNVDLGLGIDVVIISNPNELPELFNYKVNPRGDGEFEAADGFFIEPRDDGRLVMYIYPGDFSTFVSWADQNGVSHEELSRILFVDRIAETFATIAMFQKPITEGNVSYIALSNVLMNQFRRHRPPIIDTADIDVLEPLLNELVSTTASYELAIEESEQST